MKMLKLNTRSKILFAILFLLSTAVGIGQECQDRVENNIGEIVWKKPRNKIALDKLVGVYAGRTKSLLKVFRKNCAINISAINWPAQTPGLAKGILEFKATLSTKNDVLKEIDFSSFYPLEIMVPVGYYRIKEGGIWTDDSLNRISWFQLGVKDYISDSYYGTVFFLKIYLDKDTQQPTYFDLLRQEPTSPFKSKKVYRCLLNR